VTMSPFSKLNSSSCLAWNVYKALQRCLLDWDTVEPEGEEIVLLCPPAVALLSAFYNLFVKRGRDIFT
ncbi:hypothetical protein NPN13_24910, partial [Vibrio parahaemolyticus]|nr:hypothetical protein [Vibrio parahaemolyticus]